jgi:hypothetical protein
VAEACHTSVATHRKSQRMKPLRVSCAGFMANKALLLRTSLALTLEQLEHGLLRSICFKITEILTI